MSLNNIFEYPLPKIQVDLQKISINTSNQTEGKFNIKNIGGGELKGQVLTNTNCIILHNEVFESNNIDIHYYITPSIYNNGDFIKSEIIIISNGGEIIIPIEIKIFKSNYLQYVNNKFYTIKEFYDFYTKNHKEAIKLFNSFEFVIWLKNIKFKHIDIVENFLKDSNKQRAIDNFFVLSKVKEKASFFILENKIIYDYYTLNDETFGNIKLKLDGQGYFENKILKDNNCDWFFIQNEIINSKDFDENGEFNLKYKIIKHYIKNLFQKTKIKFSNKAEFIDIEIYKKFPINFVLEKYYYEMFDTGIFKIYNNFYENVFIEILPKDTFIKFEKEKYLIKEYQEIKFNIKITGFLKAQIDFNKTPFISTDILINAIIKNKVFKFKKTIFIGNNFI